MNTTAQYMTVAEVCREMRCSERTLRRMRNGDGEYASDPLPTYKFGGKVLFRRSDIERRVYRVN